MTYLETDTHMLTLQRELHSPEKELECCECGGEAEGDVSFTGDDGTHDWLCDACDERWAEEGA